MNWEDDLEFIAKVNIACQKKAQKIAEESGLKAPGGIANTLFMELMDRIKSRKITE